MSLKKKGKNGLYTCLSCLIFGAMWLNLKISSFKLAFCVWWFFFNYLVIHSVFAIWRVGSLSLTCHYTMVFCQRSTPCGKPLNPQYQLRINEPGCKICACADNSSLEGKTEQVSLEQSFFTLPQCKRLYLWCLVRFLETSSTNID